MKDTSIDSCEQKELCYATQETNSSESNHDQQPCSSYSSDNQNRSNSSMEQHEKEEIVQMWKHIDERLENKAKAMNLTSLNVKSILHHLIKYPSAIDVLLGIGGEEGLSNVRITRSHKKPSENTMSVVFEELYGKTPSTFLDLNFDENDEFDDDYAITNDEAASEDKDDEEIPIEDEEDNESLGPEPMDPFERLDQEDERERERSEATNMHHENLNDSLIRKETLYVPQIDNSYMDKSNEEFRSVVSDEYCEFLNAVFHNEEKEVAPPDEDTDDEDYNVQMDSDRISLDVDDCDEIRHDRTTEIPRDEVEKLMMDNILAEKEIPAKALPKEVITICEVSNEQSNGALRKTQKQRDAEVAERMKQLNTTDESCSLLKGNSVTFRSSEIAQLRVQLEQHVQLLTQFVVTCYLDEQLTETKNLAQRMINELESFYTKHGDHSIYNIGNLAGSIESCHHIINMQKVDAPLVKWASNTDRCEGATIRPEAIAVLAKSSAIKYPHLLPKVQPEKCETPIPFLRSEDMMLAVALLQYVHLPRRAENGLIDRYSAISANCLPARSANKIRNRMKTIRTVHKKSSPMHFIVTQAEQGICNFKFADPEILLFNCPLELWPEEYQPNWFQLFQKHFVVKDECRIVLRNVEFGSVVVKPCSMREHNPEVEMDLLGRYLQLGSVESGKPIIMKNNEIKELINHLFPEKELSKPKRQKTRKIQLSLSTALSSPGNSRSCDNVDIAEESLSNFPPSTPGNRSPSECDIFEAHSLGTFDDVSRDRGISVPATPRGYGEDSQSAWFTGICEQGNTDFRNLEKNDDCCSSESNHCRPSTSKSQRITSIDLESDDDLEFSSKQDDLTRRKRKRTRIEKESMGKIGLEDYESKYSKKILIAQKMMSDVKNRLFMHQEIWVQLCKLMVDGNIKERERIVTICKLLQYMPDILHLILLFTPPEYLPSEILCSEMRYSYLCAIEMMLDIDAYITAAKMKTPTVRQIFKLLAKIGAEKLSSKDAALKMHQILGHERPLWEKIEKNFYCLAYRDKSIAEDYEFIDLTNEKDFDSKTEERFEIIDDINQVVSISTASENIARSNIMVKCGQLMAISKNGLTPIEVTKTKWTKVYDMRLLTVYNQSILEKQDFNKIYIPKLLKELPFGPKSITNRLTYLLSML